MPTMNPLPTPRRQRGLSLIELMVGLSMGLLVVVVAIGAVLASRGLTGTVSDASTLQQQGAYALRVMGVQLRHAGSLYLNPDSSGGNSTDPLSTVVFETEAKPADSTGAALAFSPEQAIRYDSTGDTLSMTFRRYKDRMFVASDPVTWVHNCLGGPSDIPDSPNGKDEAVESIFRFDATKNVLTCAGNGATAQAIVQNVAQFQLTYLEQVTDAGGTKVRYVPASDVTEWRSVQGIQVCLVLYGDEAIDLPAGTDSVTLKARSYTDCAGNRVDMAGLTGVRKNRMHVLFRNVFQLRSQWLPPSQ